MPQDLQAYGRMSPFLSFSYHFELVLTEEEQIVPGPGEEVASKKKISQKKRKKHSWLRSYPSTKLK